MLKLAFRGAETAGAYVARLSAEAAAALGGAVGEQPARPERLRHTCAIILPIALLVWMILHSVTLVMSPSIDAWMIRQADGPIAKGDLVSFDLVHPLAGPAPVSLTKRVLCVAGERLRQLNLPPSGYRKERRRAFLCGGRLLGITRPFGRNGQRLPLFQWGDRAIPVGFVYVGSDHPDGFDSRYYGPVRVERLTRMERVL